VIAGAVRERYDGVAATWAAATLAAAVLIMLTGTGVVVARVIRPGPPNAAAAPPAAEPPHAPGASALISFSGDPLRVRIPAIGVDASLVRLGLNGDGTLEVPGYEEAGWYAGGSRPGDAGPAVIAAHVDSTRGPAVFYRLRKLEPGEVVHVDYEDGTVTFVVRESESFAKSRFPTARVYGPTDGPELRLVTCDGTFDRPARAYTSNLVVWADAVAPA